MSDVKPVVIRRTGRKKAKGAPAVIRLGKEDFSYYFASHAERLDAIDDMSKTLQQDIRDVRTEQAGDNRYLNERIDSVQKDLSEKMEKQTEVLTTHFDKGITLVADGQKVLGSRIGHLESWRTLILGGSAVILFLFGAIVLAAFSEPIAAFLKSFFQ